MFRVPGFFRGYAEMSHGVAEVATEVLTQEPFNMTLSDLVTFYVSCLLQDGDGDLDGILLRFFPSPGRFRK